MSGYVSLSDVPQGVWTEQLNTDNLSITFPPFLTTAGFRISRWITKQSATADLLTDSFNNLAGSYASATATPDIVNILCSTGRYPIAPMRKVLAQESGPIEG
ncbi:hypothetical protein J6590_034525 [Homalodisca vitripennis]|nr:hypothetical protein J6590_034525 [Homalodisca vitripennis]